MFIPNYQPGLRIRLHENFANDGFYLFIREKNPETGQMYFAETLQMKLVENMSIDPNPVAQFTRENIQDLFNQLWQLGFRPKKFGEAEGELKATKFHLEDMRKTNEYLLRKTDEFIKIVSNPWKEVENE